MDTLRDRNHLEELWSSGARSVADVGLADERSTRRPRRSSTPTSGASRRVPAHRPHRLQGRLAGAVAAVARRARDRLLRRACRREPSLYELARVGEGMESIEGDVRDPEAVAAAVAAAAPEVVIHMAAQSLVRRSFAEPRETYETNVMGTVNVLDAVRRTATGVRAVVNVTSDKCYENREWEWGYREDEPMGGHDPYSNSKGCAELVTERLPPLVLLRPDGPRAGLGARRAT